MWFHWCESFMLLSFFLFWNFVPYLLLFQGIKNFIAMSRSSQNGGDRENTPPLRGEERKIRYFSTRYWLQQKFDVQAASVFSAVMYILCVPVALKHTCSVYTLH